MKCMEIHNKTTEIYIPCCLLKELYFCVYLLMWGICLTSNILGWGTHASPSS